MTYSSGFFANIRVSWYSPKKSRRILLAGKKKILEFDDNENDKKLTIYNKGIEYNKRKKIKQWLYRTGSIQIPNIEHKESLEVMIREFVNFHRRKKNNFDIFKHALRVMKVLNQIKKNQ